MRSGRRISGRGGVDHLLLCGSRLKSMTFFHWLYCMYLMLLMLYVRYVRLCLLGYALLGESWLFQVRFGLAWLVSINDSHG